MSKTVTLADVVLGLEMMGVTGDPRTIAQVTISPEGPGVGRVRVLRKHQRDGMDWVDEGGNLVMTREDIRIVARVEPVESQPCAHCGVTELPHDIACPSLRSAATATSGGAAWPTGEVSTMQFS